MSLIYTIPENKPFSSWIVSGNEARFILWSLNKYQDIKTSKRNMDRTRKVMRGENELHRTENRNANRNKSGM